MVACQNESYGLWFGCEKCSSADRYFSSHCTKVLTAAFKPREACLRLPSQTGDSSKFEEKSSHQSLWHFFKCEQVLSGGTVQGREIGQ